MYKHTLNSLFVVSKPELSIIDISFIASNDYARRLQVEARADCLRLLLCFIGSVLELDSLFHELRANTEDKSC